MGLLDACSSGVAFAGSLGGQSLAGDFAARAFSGGLLSACHARVQECEKWGILGGGGTGGWGWGEATRKRRNRELLKLESRSARDAECPNGPWRATTPGKRSRPHHPFPDFSYKGRSKVYRSGDGLISLLVFGFDLPLQYTGRKGTLTAFSISA